MQQINKYFPSTWFSQKNIAYKDCRQGTTSGRGFKESMFCIHCNSQLECYINVINLEFLDKAYSI